MEKPEIFFAHNKKHAQAIVKNRLQKLGFWTHRLKTLHLQQENSWLAVYEEHEPVKDRVKR